MKNTFSLFFGKEEESNIIRLYFYKFEFSVVTVGYEGPESGLHVPSCFASFTTRSVHVGSS